MFLILRETIIQELQKNYNIYLRNMIFYIGNSINKYEMVINNLFRNNGCVPFHSYIHFNILSLINNTSNFRFVYFKETNCELVTFIEKRTEKIWQCSIPAYPLLFSGTLSPIYLKNLLVNIINELKIEAIYFPLIYNKLGLMELFSKVPDAITWCRLPTIIINWKQSKLLFWETVVDRYLYNANRKRIIFERDLQIKVVNKKNAPCILENIEINSWKYKCHQDLLSKGNQFRYYTSLIENDIAKLVVAYDRKSNLPVAYRIDTIYKKTLLILKWSYSELFKRYSPGFYLLSKSLIDFRILNFMKRLNRQILLPSILFSIIVILYLFISKSVIAQMQFEWVKNYPNFQVHSATIFCEGYYSNTDATKIIFITVLGIQNFNKLILSNKLI